MTFPLWIDPTPLTREFVGSFADAPVREPFFQQRKQTEEEQLTVAQLRQRAGGETKARLYGALGGAVISRRANADMAVRGETKTQRLARQKREYEQRKLRRK